MSFCANVSDLFHELRSAAGTVLSIVGSRLEADSRARVDEVGPQWLNEFEEQRDSLEPDEVGECICWVGHGDCGGCSGVLGITHEPACGWAWDPDCPQHGEGLRASSTVQRRQCSKCDQRESDPGAVSTPAPGERFPGDRQSTVDLLQAACYLIRDDAPVLTAKIRARVAELQAEKQVREDDLAAHIMGDFVSGQEVDPLTATLIDALSSSIARSLLSGYSITRRA